MSFDMWISFITLTLIMDAEHMQELNMQIYHYYTVCRVAAVLPHGLLGQ